MASGQHKALSLLEQPLHNHWGDGSILKDNTLTFKGIKSISTVEAGLIGEIIDICYSNNVFVFCFADGIIIHNLASNDITVPISKFNGSVSVGSFIYIFDINSVIEIDTSARQYSVKTITINNTNLNIDCVVQPLPQVFFLVTLNPTTLYMFDVFSLPTINSSINLIPTNYITLPQPKANINISTQKDLIYVYGEGGTSVVNLPSLNVLYFSAKQYFPYKFSGYDTETDTIQFIRHGYSFDRYWNKARSVNLFIPRINSETNPIYFGASYFFITTDILFDISNRNILYLDDFNTIQPANFRHSVYLDFTSITKLFNIRYNIDYIYSETVNQPKLHITTRMKNATYQKVYRTQYNVTEYITPRVGTAFEISFIADAPVKFRDIAGVFG